MGRAFKYGDNIDTDVIIPARYLTSTDPLELAAHALEDLDPSFVAEVRPGDVIVAGNNFGCGSSREHAPMALGGSGVSGVVAKSLARIFFRNAVNTGLAVLVCPEAVDAIDDGDEVELDIASGTVTVIGKELSFGAEPMPDFVAEIVASGGLVEWVRERVPVERR